jgi:hypothetical protein
LRSSAQLRGAELASLLAAAALGACAGGDEKEEVERLPVPQNVATVAIERQGFRLRYPETWSIATDAPEHDPDAFFLLEGPDGATVAFMLLDEPADPAALVDAVLAGHGLADATERDVEQWGRYAGHGRDVFGLNQAGVPAGMRAFAHSTGERSFLVAESYVEYAYAEARQGFDAVELSFTLLGEDGGWPAVSLGTRVEEGGRVERWLVRSGFELRFPDGWRVDVESPDYDPDGFFTLLPPIESAWMVVQLLPGEHDAAALLADARTGLAGVLSEVHGEELFERWGGLEGRGVALRGAERGLPATLRVFVHARADQALLVTSFRYDEVAPRVEPGFQRVAETFRFRE